MYRGPRFFLLTVNGDGGERERERKREDLLATGDRVSNRLDHHKTVNEGAYCGRPLIP